MLILAVSPLHRTDLAVDSARIESKMWSVLRLAVTSDAKLRIVDVQARPTIGPMTPGPVSAGCLDSLWPSWKYPSCIHV